MRIRDMGRSGLSVLLVFVMLFTPLLQGNVQAAKNPDPVPVTVYEGNGMKIDFTIDSQWSDAFNATIKIENTGTQPIENWAVSFCFPHQITNIWNASIIETQENMYTIKNLGWNQDIPVGGSVNFGFTANASGVVMNPSQFFLNTKNQTVGTESFQADYAVKKDWVSGYTASLKIQNLSTKAIEDWTISFDFARNIDSISNGIIVSHEGTHYVIKNADYNQNIPAGETITLGINGSAGTSTDAPVNFAMQQITLMFDFTADTDGDGFLDWVEICVNGTDPLVPDGVIPSPTPTPIEVSPTPIEPTPTIIPTVSPTPIPDEDNDGDSLPDTYEIVIIKYLAMNGIELIDVESVLPSDDYDEDGLSLMQEYYYDTNPFLVDSDDDGLNDYDEVYIYKTNPIQKDTDKDNMGDGTEIDAGLDPLSSDTDGDGIADSEEIVSQNVRLESVQENDISQSLVEPSVVITGKGDYSENLYALMIEDYNAVFDIPSIVGRPFEFVHDSDLAFEESTLTFQISDSALADNNIVDLKIAYYDEETNSLEPIETIYNKATNTISANVSHYSIYTVINWKAFIYNLQSHSNSSVDSTIERYEYNGNKYALIDSSMSWDDARDYCTTLGGHLVIIDNVDEQTYLSTMMELYGSKNLYWIGLSGEDEQCSWVDGTPLSFENWAAGEPNSTEETAVHMYCKEQAGFSCGQWNDTYNDFFAGTSFFWSTDNCGILCEWEDTADTPQSGFWISLSNGTMVKLDKDPSLGDESVDSDDDGIPDLFELKRIETGLYLEFAAWTFYSNPAKADTDGDGLEDLEDLNPCQYDTVVIENTDSLIKFNTGRTWYNITCNSFDFIDNMFLMIDYKADNPIPPDEFKVIVTNYYQNSQQKFSLDELAFIGLINNEGSKLYMDDISNGARENVFERLTGRESKYYQHSGILWWEDWNEVPKGTEGGFFKGKVLSEADLNFSIKLYFVCDVYTVLDSLVKIGALVIVVIVAIKAAPIVLANIQAIIYFVKTYGVSEGLKMYGYLGISNLPDGVITWVQMDMADGDSSVDDFASAIKGTQPNIEGTNVPKSFEIKGLKVNGETVWVHGNATKHIGIFINRVNESGLGEGGLLVERELMNSFLNAARLALQEPLIEGRNFLIVGGWELGIDTTTSVIYHARMLG